MVVATRRSKRAAAKALVPTSPASSDSEDIEEEFVPSPKKRKTSVRSSKKAPEPANFEENHLYRALSSPDIAVSDLALEWIEKYMEDEENNNNDSFTELFNLLLRCCGCVNLAQPHDLLNVDSAADTVAELAMMFEKQKLHEYPFISTNKDLRFFRKNVVEFFDNVVIFAHEKGCLYELETGDSVSLSSPLMTTVMSWFGALSACTIRPFRFVSTVVLLGIQTQLCDQAVGVTISLEKQQRQLNNTKNSKTKRNQKAHEAKIKIITDSIQTFHNQKDAILEYLGEIVQTVFIHRYRDVDSSIRTECLRALGLWMTMNEDFFFQSSYLRYFGWLLSDPADNVREEVIKVLHKLYKHSSGASENMGIGFRQFTDRFKKQLINMVWKEKQASIKIHLVGIYIELFKFGFLSASETYEVGLYAFYLAESPSTASNDRAKVELCKFMSAITTENTQAELEKYSGLLATHDSPQFGEGKLSLESCLKYKFLVKLLQSSYGVYNSSKRLDISIRSAEVSPRSLIEIIFQSMYTLPNFAGDWEILIRFILYDLSSIKFIPQEVESINEAELDELISGLELSSDDDKYYFMSLISGAITYILGRKPSRKIDTADNVDDFHNVFPKLARYLPELEAFLAKGRKVYTVFMKIWNAVLLPLPLALPKIFNDAGQREAYNSLHGNVLKYFLDMEITDLDTTTLFEEYFSKLLQHFDGRDSHDSTNSERIINGSISLKVEDLLLSLSTETTEALNSHDVLADVVDENDSPLLEDQKELCYTMLKVTNPLFKLTQLAEVININRFVAEPILESRSSVLELLNVKLLSKIDFQSLIQHWPINFLKILLQVIQSWKSILDFVLSSLCWKLEDLMYASKDHSALTINIDVFLDDFSVIVTSIAAIFVSIDNSINVLNDSSESVLKQLIEKLVELDSIFSAKVIDIFVSLRVFYRKLHGNNTFQNFNEFFEDEERLGRLVQQHVPQEVERSLMNAFFIKEARLGRLLLQDLERGDKEGVNFDDLVFEAEHPVTVEKEYSTFDSSDDDESDDAEVKRNRLLAELEVERTVTEAKIRFTKEQTIWKAEKSLCVYAVKLFSLLNTGGLSAEAMTRLRLNGDKLGVLYQKILEQNDKIQPEEATAEGS